MRTTKHESIVCSRPCLNPTSSRLWLVVYALLFVSGCSLPTDQTNHRDACAFLADNPAILQSTLYTTQAPKSQAQILSIIKHESNHQAHARPVASWFIQSWIPRSYHSSAYGYAQGTRATWQDFQQKTRSRRYQSSYHDNIQFIDWYFSTRGHLIKPYHSENYGRYLLYHDGPTAYHKGKSHSAKFRYYAERVAQSTDRADEQLQRCQKTLAWQQQWLTF